PVVLYPLSLHDALPIYRQTFGIVAGLADLVADEGIDLGRQGVEFLGAVQGQKQHAVAHFQQGQFDFHVHSLSCIAIAASTGTTRSPMTMTGLHSTLAMAGSDSRAACNWLSRAAMASAGTAGSPRKAAQARALLRRAKARSTLCGVAGS